jgi:hypothetical protein
MSGGIEETYNLVNMRYSRASAPKLDHDSFWNILITARKKSSVIGCNIELKEYSYILKNILISLFMNHYLNYFLNN